MKTHLSFSTLIAEVVITNYYQHSNECELPAFLKCLIICFFPELNCMIMYVLLHYSIMRYIYIHIYIYNHLYKEPQDNFILT